MKTQYNLIIFVLFYFLVFTNDLSAQTDWIKDLSNPVLRRDTVVATLPKDLYAISDCWVLKEGSTYKMWYTCGGFNYPPDTLMRSRICYATSTDGISWDKYTANPVLDISYSGAWDSLGVETVSIIIDEDASASERYKMWYAGQYFNSFRYEIGYAFSPDGINWTKHSNPVLAVGDSTEWDNGFLEGPTVIKDAGIYKMWYCGYDVTVDGSGTDGKANLGYATSTDGINWIKYAGNPIITTGINSWDSIYVQDPHVIKEGSEYRMWYGGGSNDTYYDQQVGYATSTDGISWVKSPLNPVLTRGNSGDWDEILSSFPSVINDGGNYKMWYTGRNVDPLPVASLDYYWEIGYATSVNVGINNENSAKYTETFVSPNPASKDIKLNILLNNTDEITITNLFGQELIKVSNQNHIDISNLANGIYILTIEQGQTIYTQKFIKE